MKLQRRARARTKGRGLGRARRVEGACGPCSSSQVVGSGTDRETITALIEALQDEYQARATYRRVIEAFGEVRPFVNIVASEDRHVGALLRHFGRLGIEPPPDEWYARISTPHSLEAACEAAVRAEIENAAMYERLLNAVNDEGVRRTLLRLRQASQTRHLPAFQRCLARLQTNRRSS